MSCALSFPSPFLPPRARGALFLRVVEEGVGVRCSAGFSCLAELDAVLFCARGVQNRQIAISMNTALQELLSCKATLFIEQLFARRVTQWKSNAEH